MINRFKVSTAVFFTLLAILYSQVSYGIEIVYTFDGVVQEARDEANKYGWYVNDPIRIQFVYDNNPDEINTSDSLVEWEWTNINKHIVYKKNDSIWEPIPLSGDNKWVWLRTTKTQTGTKVQAHSVATHYTVTLFLDGLTHVLEDKLSGVINYTNSTFAFRKAFRPYDYYNLRGTLTNSFLNVPITSQINDTEVEPGVAASIDQLIDKILDQPRMEQLSAKVFAEGEKKVAYALEEAKFYWDLINDYKGTIANKFTGDLIKDPIDLSIKSLEIQGELILECITDATDCAMLFNSNSPSYVYTKELSNGSIQGLSFYYKGEGLSEDDYLFVGVDDKLLLSVPGTDIPEGEYKYSKIIDVSDLKDGAVFSMGIISNESGKKLYIKDITFYSEDEAPVNNTQTNYRIDLIGDVFATPIAVNDQGQVVGHIVHSNNELETFLYEQGKFKSLGLGGTTNYPSEINNLGQIVGTIHYEDGGNEAFLYQNGQMTGLGKIVGNPSAADSINDLGQILGTTTVPDNPFGKAFIYQNGKMDLIDAGLARSINNKGQVLGDTFEGWSIYENGKQTKFGSLGGKSSSAKSINNKGHVVGFVVFGEGGEREIKAFLYKNGEMKIIEGKNGVIPERAYSINDHDQIVGEMDSNGPYINEAFIYDNGEVRSLFGLVSKNKEGWSGLLWAFDINNKGQIVGSGEYNGESRPFLLTPIEGTDLESPLNSKVVYDPVTQEVNIPCVQLINDETGATYAVKMEANDDFIFHLTVVTDVDFQSCEVTYDMVTSILTIPSVVVDGDTTGTQYFVEMTADENYEFSISNFYTLE